MSTNVVNTDDHANLADIPLMKALSRAYSASTMTYTDIGVLIGRSKSAVNRYFTDPLYNPPLHLVPEICLALGNNILLEWLCVQADGHFVKALNMTDLTDAGLTASFGEVSHKFATVVTDVSAAMEDGKYDAEELVQIERDAEELARDVERLRMLARNMRNKGANNG